MKAGLVALALFCVAFASIGCGSGTTNAQEIKPPPGAPAPGAPAGAPTSGGAPSSNAPAAPKMTAPKPPGGK